VIGTAGDRRYAPARRAGLLLSSLVALLVFDPYAHAAPATIGDRAYGVASHGETVLATFTAPEGGASAGSYAHLVALKVSGFGAASGPALNDAFYVFTDRTGEPAAPANGDYYQLTLSLTALVASPLDTTPGPTPADALAKVFIVYDLDAGLAAGPGYVPAYREDHTYQFVVDVGDAASQLHFGVADGTFADNTGAYEIEIRELVPVGAPEGWGLLALGLLAGFLVRWRS
jgi:hypothetical protein